MPGDGPRLPVRSPRRHAPAITRIEALLDPAGDAGFSRPAPGRRLRNVYQHHGANAARLDSYPANPKKCKCPEDEATVIYETDRRKVFRCELCGREWQRHFNNLVFPSTVGTFTSPRNFQRKFYDILVNAKIEHINLHGLRHTFATRLIEEGEDIRVVRALLRHADIKTTATVYAHVTAKAKKKAPNRMDNVLRREISPEPE